MDRTGIRDLAVTSVGLAARPRRRWSDGPNYAGPHAAEDDWSLAAHWPALVAALCEEVAAATGDLARDVTRLGEQGRLSGADVQALRGSTERMRLAGAAMQQIVRLGAGLFNLSPDRVDLAQLARSAVREQRIASLGEGIQVSCELRRAEVWVDGAIASGLISAGLNWALSFSRKVRVKVTPGAIGEAARVVIRGTMACTPHTGNRRMNDNLHWVLLRQLADCARLPVGRSSSAATESAVIEFPASLG